MQLSKTADHALRAVLYLAGNAGEGPIPADRIAERLGAPRNYMSKTLQALSRVGVVEGFRGPAGGFCLAVPADELTLADVIEAFDEPTRRRVCLLGDRPCHDDDPCGAHTCWTSLRAHAQEPFRSTTVADLLGGRCALSDGRSASPETHDRPEALPVDPAA